MYPTRVVSAWTLEVNSDRYKKVNRDRKHAQEKLSQLRAEHEAVLQKVRETNNPSDRKLLESIESRLDDWELEAFSAMIDWR